MNNKKRKVTSTVKHLLFGALALLLFFYSIEEGGLLFMLLPLGLLAIPAIRHRISLNSLLNIKMYYFNYHNYHLAVLACLCIALFVLEESRYGFLWAIGILGICIPYLITYTNEKKTALSVTSDESVPKEKFRLKKLIPSANFSKYGMLFSIGFALFPLVLAIFAGGMAGILMLLTVPIGVGLFILFLILFLVQRYCVKDLKETNPNGLPHSENSNTPFQSERF